VVAQAFYLTLAMRQLSPIRRGLPASAWARRTDPQNPPTLAGICAYLEAEGLAKYKWPERLELIDALPRSHSGRSPR
jgi:acyl-CoA synthetase